jgi:hypothetical protein
MTPRDFASALIAYCYATTGSVTSWGRTPLHNRRVGGVTHSKHQLWLGADVVYDTRPTLATARRRATALGLKLLREADHDHLQAL